MNDFELLNGALVNQRNHVLVAVDGLSEQELTTPVAPSHWTPAGLVQHLAFDVERNWFRAVFAGQNVANESGPARAWDVASGGGAAVIERYRHECTLADEVIAAHASSDEPVAWPERFSTSRLSNLYEIMLHVVTETACHAGHLDIVRENLDGTQYVVID